MGCASRRLLVPVGAIALAGLNLAAAPPANPAAAIAASAGHPSRAHVRAHAAQVRDGRDETATLDVDGPRRLERTCSGGLCRGTWFDGREQFSFGINGTPLPESSASARRERTYAAIASTGFAEPEFLASGGSVAAMPPADGLRFAVSASAGDELIAVADPRTGRLTRVDLPDGTPFRTLTATQSGDLTVYGMRRYDGAERVGEPLGAPAGPTVSFAPAADTGALEATLPVVPCLLARRRAACLIDTGTNPSAITLDLAEQLGVEPRGQIEIGGFSKYLTGVVDAGPLTVGEATFGRLSLAVVPRAHGARFDVILGSDALAAVRVDFDRAGRRVRIARDAGEPAPGAATELTFDNGVPYVQVRLGERGRPEAMILDTGDSDALSIGYDEYRDDMQLFAVQGSGQATGLGGEPMDTLTGTLERADIGGNPVAGLPIDAVRGQHVGHVGFGYVGRCAHFTLALGRRQAECDEPSPRAASREGQADVRIALPRS